MQQIIVTRLGKNSALWTDQALCKHRGKEASRCGYLTDTALRSRGMGKVVLHLCHAPPPTLPYSSCSCFAYRIILSVSG